MAESINESNRRDVLRAAAGLAVGHAAIVGLASASVRAQEVLREGTPHDFDFLAGEWKINNRRLKDAASDQWDLFDGEATCWSILDGAGSIEELRIPQRKFSGMGLRLLDKEKKVWNDYWVNAKSGVLTTPGQQGIFIDGVGTFTADDVDGDKPIKVRGVWDRITPNSCRWYQSISRDDGKTWEDNWYMDWTRVAKRA